MKFTVAFVTLLSISSSWAVLAKRAEEPKDKREAPTSYAQSSSGHSSSSYQAPSLSHGDASAINVGAGYSIGGVKPAYSFGGLGSGAGLQLSSEGLQHGQGGPIQLAPITLQPGQDLSQLMSQLQHSLGAGALSLQPSNTVAEFHESQGQGGQEYSFPQFQQYAAPQYQQYQLAGQIASAPSYAAGTKGLSSYGQTGPVLFNPSQEHGAQQAGLSYAAPSTGNSASDAGSLSLGGAGHSLAGFSLGSGHSSGGAALPSGGYSLAGLGQSLGGAGLSFDGTGFTLGGSGHSFGGSGNALGGYSLGSLGGAGHSLGNSGLSLGGSGYSLGGSGHSQGGSGHSQGASGGHSLGGSGGHSLGNSGGHSLGSSGGHSLSSSGGHSLGSSGSSHGGLGHSFGGSGSKAGAHYKVLSSGSHGAPGKSAFKPSTFLGASVPNDSGLSGISSFHGASSYPSFPGSYGGSSLSSHGHSFPSFPGFGGPSKQISPLYTKSEGSSYDSAGAYSSAGHLASPPGTTYGFPTSSYPAGPVHAASSAGPQYYISSSKYPSSFGEGSSSYKSPSSSHSSLSSHSSGPKYSFGGQGSSSRYSSPKDSHGAYSETSYNTIKYSEELKPHVH